jgi:hypothetical protein
MGGCSLGKFETVAGSGEEGGTAAVFRLALLCQGVLTHLAQFYVAWTIDPRKLRVFNVYVSIANVMLEMSG